MNSNILSSRFLSSVVHLFVLIFSFCSSSAACPLIDGLVDINCDGVLKISATGDSIVRGTGDKDGNSNNAGWVFDLQQYFPTARIPNVGVPGTTSQELRRLFLRHLIPGDVTYKEMNGADYVLIEVGTNDYWNKKPVDVTVQGIKRLIDTLRDFYLENLQIPEPIFVVATVPQSKRSFQNPFLLSLDKALLKKKESLNVRILFHTLGTGIISKDLLHPSPKGYTKMAEVVAGVLRGVIQTQAQSIRPDLDQDGIYDLFEAVYGTSPLLIDSDGDGFSDGDEVFSRFSDPLDASSF